MLRRLGVLGLAAATLATLAVTGPPSAVAAEDNVWATVRNVSAQVDRIGGITVRGEVSCKAAVERWEEQNGTSLPAYAQVLVGLQWTAYQPVGRRATVTASWGSDFMSPCYSVEEPDAFWPWATAHAGSPADFYVYSTAGRFAKGRVHIDVTMYGGFDPNSGGSEWNVIIVAPDPAEPEPLEIAVEVFTAQQFDVRAR